MNVYIFKRLWILIPCLLHIFASKHVCLAEKMNDGQDDNSKHVRSNTTVTSVLVGQSAKLSCPIPSELFGTKISWIRKRDFLLLSVGESLYTTDNRFFVSHSRHSHHPGARYSQVWFLHVLNVTKKDEGEYECQTSSHPPTSIFSYLLVHNASSQILGPLERVVEAGSQLRLECKLQNSTSNPSFVFWYKDEKMINYDKLLGYNVVTENDHSMLTVSSVTIAHSGNYTCDPSNATPSSVIVHVAGGGSFATKRYHQEDGGSSKDNKKSKNIRDDKTSVRQLGVKSPSSSCSSLDIRPILACLLCILYHIVT